MNILQNNNIIIAKYLLKGGTCLLSKLIDTQVARRGRQYHRNPATKKKKKKYISKVC